MNYLLCGTLKRPNAPELFAPESEACEMLKGSVVGGPSLVFCRKHEAGVTIIRSHKHQDAKVCRKVLGYDANALHPSTLLGWMPYGKRVVQDWPQTEDCLRISIDAVKTERWFGFAEVDIEVPTELWPKFEEMPPLFYNRPVPSEAVPQHMKDYLVKSKRKPMYDQQKLVGALSAEKILLYAPLLKWYLEQGLKITAVHRTINYKRGTPFTWFVSKVTENRRKGVKNPELSLLAEVFNLLGNSAYGKMIEVLERQTTVKCTKNENILMKDLRSVWFEDLEEIGDVYEIEMRKQKVVINKPFQVGIAVYQMAKLRILQFY